jgi:hypothetical protein
MKIERERIFNSCIRDVYKEAILYGKRDTFSIKEIERRISNRMECEYFSSADRTLYVLQILLINYAEMRDIARHDEEFYLFVKSNYKYTKMWFVTAEVFNG